MLKSLARALLFLFAAAVTTFPAAAQTGIAIEPGASCVSSSCHDDQGKRKFVHSPAAATGEKCIACHKTVQDGRHEFKLVAEDGELCAICHKDIADKEFAHVPVAEGLCSFCHDPHQSDNPNQLFSPPNSELCFSCHDNEPFADATTHGPVQDGDCLKCHDPHASNYYSQLRAEPPDLCFQCHNKTLKDAAGKRLPSPKRTFENSAMKLHPPFEVGDCLSCHKAHSSENYRLLVAPYPETIYTKYSPEKYVCFECHDEEIAAEPRTQDATNFRNGNLNLHYRHVNREKGRGCKACHDHHGALNDKLIREEVPFGKRTIVIRKFETTQTGGTCAPMCHRAVSYDRYDPVFNRLRVTPREGVDATAEELQRAKETDLGG